MVLPMLAASLPSFTAERIEGAFADLAITLSASPELVAAGSSLTYTAVLTNLGPDAVPEVYIAMPVPTGTALVSAVLDGPGGATACHLRGGVVECTSYFGNGATTTATPRTATIVVAVAGGATGSLTATATAAPVFLFMPPPPPADPDLSNNSATLITTVGTSAGVPSVNRFGLVLIALVLGLVGMIAVRPVK